MPDPLTRIRIGAIQIVDENGDGRFDPSIDRITDSTSNRELRPDASEVRQALASLGISSVGQIRSLPGVRRYIALMEFAEESAAGGQDGDCERFLRFARSNSRAAGIRFDENRATRITRLAHENHVKYLVRSAAMAASTSGESGDPCINALRGAALYAAQHGISFDEPQARLEICAGLADSQAPF